MRIKLLIASVFLMAFTYVKDDHKVLNLSSSLTLKLESSSGTNACAVAYNEKLNIYYTAMAGNKSFPLEVFNSSGVNIKTTTTMCDSRGMWMSKGKLYALTAGENAEVFEYTLDNNGYPISSTKVLSCDKPSFNSCGTLVKKKKVYFYNKGYVYYNTVKKNDLSTPLGLKLSSTVGINSYSVIHTGIKKHEIGVLDYKNKRVLLFNSKTGNQTATCHLPSTAVCDPSFGFSYCNEYIWLYDKENKEWKGYKLTL